MQFSLPCIILPLDILNAVREGQRENHINLVNSGQEPGHKTTHDKAVLAGSPPIARRWPSCFCGRPLFFNFLNVLFALLFPTTISGE